MDNEPPGRLGTRVAQRFQVEAMIEARAGDNRRPALATDISVSGVRLKTTSPLKVGQRFWVKFANMAALNVTVSWVDGFTAGCSFAEPLADYVVDHIIKTANAASPPVKDRRAVPR